MILADAIEDFAAEENISIEEARNLLINSKAYNCLYAPDSNLWMEGPDYFLDFFRRIESRKHINQTQEKESAG